MNSDDATADAKKPAIQSATSGEDEGSEATEASPATARSGAESDGFESASPVEPLSTGEDGELKPTAAGAPDAASGEAVPMREHGTPSMLPVAGQPTFLLFGIVASVSLVLDVVSKGWAEVALKNRPTHPVTLIEDHLALTLAYNPGGAWGLLTNQPEDIRKPFFVFVSVAAILFIVSLYSRLAPGQRALTWGLPLVLGGALGNLADRITRSKVIDFIDYRADWVRSMNELIAKYFTNWSVTDHWPTFNVADIAICVGVGLMAVDMMTSRRGSHHPPDPEPKSAEPASPAPEGPSQPSSATQ